jgi:hypothetical protein
MKLASSLGLNQYYHGRTIDLFKDSRISSNIILYLSLLCYFTLLGLEEIIEFSAGNSANH